MMSRLIAHGNVKGVNCSDLPKKPLDMRRRRVRMRRECDLVRSFPKA